MLFELQFSIYQHFGREQQGLTYYSSPIDFNIFLCVVFSTEGMKSCIYHNREGKIGNNNVFFLIHHALESKGVLVDAKEKGLSEYLTLGFINLEARKRTTRCCGDCCVLFITIHSKL